jgi:MYND finger
MLQGLHDRAAAAAAADGGRLPHTRATRALPADEPRDAVTLHARGAQLGFDAARIAECAAAQCNECGGAACASEHPVVGGSSLLAAWAGAIALARAVAAARGLKLGEGAVATPADVCAVLLGDAGMAEAAADVLLAHVRRYLPVLLLQRGVLMRSLLELAVMVQAPLPCFHEPMQWCAACATPQAYMVVTTSAKWCSGCNCLRYCSKRCQAADWRAGHKRLCAALAALKGSCEGGGVSGGAGSD